MSLKLSCRCPCPLAQAYSHAYLSHCVSMYHMNRSTRLLELDALGMPISQSANAAKVVPSHVPKCASALVFKMTL
jgi:hypothetical protein